MRFFFVVAALALASTVAAKGSYSKHPEYHKRKAPKGNKPPRNPASGTTSAKRPGVESASVGVAAGVDAVVNAETGNFLASNPVNGAGVATLTEEITLVTLTAVELEGATVASLVISAGPDITAGLQLSGLIDAEAHLQLGVGGVAASESTCSPLFLPVTCGIQPKEDSQRMVKRSLVGTAAEIVVDAAVKFEVVTDLVAAGIGQVAASVCLVAEASVDAKVLALTSVKKGGLELDLAAFADVKASTFFLIAIDIELAKKHNIAIPGIF